MTFQFESFMEFMLMNGHGSYVWASYLITFIALLVLVLVPYRRQRQLLIRLKRQQRIESQLTAET